MAKEVDLPSTESSAATSSFADAASKYKALNCPAGNATVWPWQETAFFSSCTPIRNGMPAETTGSLIISDGMAAPSPSKSPWRPEPRAEKALKLNGRSTGRETGADKTGDPIASASVRIWYGAKDNFNLPRETARDPIGFSMP